MSPENIDVKKSEPLQSSQISIQPAGGNKYFVHLTDIPKDSEIKVYDGQQNLLYSEVSNTNTYSKLITVEENKVEQLKFSIVEKGDKESDLLSVPLQMKEWTYFKEEKDVPTDKEWEIKFTGSVTPQDLINQKIYILNSEGEKVPIYFSSNETNTIVTLRLQNSFKSGETYYIYVENDVRNQSNKPLERGYIKIFTTKL